MRAWNELTTTGRLGRAGFWLRNAVGLGGVLRGVRQEPQGVVLEHIYDF